MQCSALGTIESTELNRIVDGEGSTLCGTLTDLGECAPILNQSLMTIFVYKSLHMIITHVGFGRFDLQ